MNRRSAYQENGQALVEFAIALPVIIVLILGLFDGGRAVLYYTEISNASRVGARVAIVNQSNEADCTGPDLTFKCAAANITVATSVDPGAIDDVEILPADSDCALPSGCTATVKVSYQFQPVTPFVSTVFGTINLEASTTMPLERVYDGSATP